MKYKRITWRNKLGNNSNKQLKLDKTGCMIRVQCLPTMYKCCAVISNYSVKLEKHVIVNDAMN